MKELTLVLFFFYIGTLLLTKLHTLFGFHQLFHQCHVSVSRSSAGHTGVRSPQSALACASALAGSFFPALGRPEQHWQVSREK